MPLLWVVERDGAQPKVSTSNEEQAKVYPRVVVDVIVVGLELRANFAFTRAARSSSLASLLPIV